MLFHHYQQLTALENTLAELVSCIRHTKELKNKKRSEQVAPLPTMLYFLIHRLPFSVTIHAWSLNGLSMHLLYSKNDIHSFTSCSSPSNFCMICSKYSPLQIHFMMYTLPALTRKFGWLYFFYYYSIIFVVIDMG